MEQKEKSKYNEQVNEIFNSRKVPYELFKVCKSIYWLHELDDGDIEDAVKFIWAFSEINGFKMKKEKFDYMVKQTEYGLMHPMEKFNPDIIGTDEHKLRFLAIELLINLTSEVYLTDPLIYVLPIDTEEKMKERIEEYKQKPKYTDMFTYTTPEKLYFKKYLEQYKAGVATEDIKVDMDEVDKEYNLNLNKIKDRDKRVKYRDIEMIDADTKEVVHTFKDRAECMEMTGISKQRLYQVLSSCKIRQQGIYKYNGWQTWKDKDNGKRYHFHEKYKDE